MTDNTEDDPPKDTHEKRGATFGPTQENLGHVVPVIDSPVNDLRPEHDARDETENEIT